MHINILGLKVPVLPKRLTFVAESPFSQCELDEVLRHEGGLVGPDPDDEPERLVVLDAVAVEVAVRTVGFRRQAFRFGQQSHGRRVAWRHAEKKEEKAWLS